MDSALSFSPGTDLEACPEQALPGLDSGSPESLPGRPEAKTCSIWLLRLTRGVLCRQERGRSPGFFRSGSLPRKSAAVRCSRSPPRQTGQERRGEKTTLFVSLSGRQPCVQPVTCPGTGRLLLSPETVQLYPLFTGKGPGARGLLYPLRRGFRQTLPHKVPLPARKSHRVRQGISCLAGQTGFRVQKMLLNGKGRETLPGDNVPEQAFRQEENSRSPEARDQDTSCTTILGAGPMYFGNRALGPEGQEETGKPGEARLAVCPGQILPQVRKGWPPTLNDSCTKEDRDCPARRGPIFCPPESPCARRSPWPADFVRSR